MKTNVLNVDMEAEHLLTEYLVLKHQYKQMLNQYLVNKYVGQYVLDKNTNAYMHIVETNLMSDKKLKTFSGPCIFFVNDGEEIQYENSTNAFIFENSINEDNCSIDGFEIVSKDKYIEMLKKIVSILEGIKDKIVNDTL